MDEVRGSAPKPWAYALVVLGPVLFVVACFLPYYSLQNAPPSFDPTLYRLQTMRQTGLGAFGGILILFSGPVALAIVASLGIRRPQGWTAVATVAITVVWALMWLGILLSGGSLFPEKEIGYWLLLVSVGIVIAGATTVAVSHRRTGTPEPTSPAEGS